MDSEKVTEPNGVGEANPFTGESYNEIMFIMAARTYDVLMALLRESSPDTARDLLEAHSGGLILGPTPAFVGRFITDEINEPES